MLLACRVVSPRSSTRRTGREAGRTIAGGSGMCGGLVVGAGCLVSSRADYSDAMMRNDGAEDVSCFRCPMIAVFLSFLFPSSPPDPLPPALLDSPAWIVPPPPGVGGAGYCRSAAVGGTAICLLPIMPCRSLAVARSLLLLGLSFGAVLTAPCRAICLGCLIVSIPRSSVFFN